MRRYCPNWFPIYQKLAGLPKQSLVKLGKLITTDQQELSPLTSILSPWGRGNIDEGEL